MVDNVVSVDQLHCYCTVAVQLVDTVVSVDQMHIDLIF